MQTKIESELEKEEPRRELNKHAMQGIHFGNDCTNQDQNTKKQTNKEEANFICCHDGKMRSRDWRQNCCVKCVSRII